MIQAILTNLLHTLIALAFFVAVYIANVLFSLFYNIEILKQDFEPERIKQSALKVLVFVIGLTLLVVSITALPVFAEMVGWQIPDEYKDLFGILVIITAVFLPTLKYIRKAYEKVNKILNEDIDNPDIKKTNILPEPAKEEDVLE